ncbi:hypothetical protein HanRHA438_Chr09g0377511 [Helianthus annuus]|nr:hypothetical protein HanRHA438_Chr09g0377511 [Helianthus annuus]
MELNLIKKPNKDSNPLNKTPNFIIKNIKHNQIKVRFFLTLNTKMKNTKPEPRNSNQCI